MTRDMQLCRWLFECIRWSNGAVDMHPAVVRDGLSHCLGSDNAVVARRAAEELKRMGDGSSLRSSLPATR